MLPFSKALTRNIRVARMHRDTDRQIHSLTNPHPARGDGAVNNDGRLKSRLPNTQTPTRDDFKTSAIMPTHRALRQSPPLSLYRQMVCRVRKAGNLVRKNRRGWVQ